MGLKNSPENRRHGDQVRARVKWTAPLLICVSVCLHGHVCEYFVPTSTFLSPLKTSLLWEMAYSTCGEYFFSLLTSISLFCFLVSLFSLGVSLLPRCLSLWFNKSCPFSGSRGGAMILKPSYPQILQASDWFRRTEEKQWHSCWQCWGRAFSTHTYARAVSELFTLFHQSVCWSLCQYYFVFSTIVYEMSRYLIGQVP